MLYHLPLPQKRKIPTEKVDQLIESLRAVVGPKAVLAKPEELLVYECDGLPQHKHIPRAVVFPESTEATAEVMRVLSRYEVPYTPRGAGTGLSGGALALNQGVVIELARMRKIISIDAHNRVARVQTGVVNLHVSRAVAHVGLHYIPDPSSQPTCTIGGNIAESAGGIHCLKYGTTTDHVLSARVVLTNGEVVELAGGETGSAGYDLLGVFVGSEGTFGIATEATLRLAPIPPAVRTLLAEFAEVDAASHAVSAIIAAGVMPAALEMMDREIIRAIEASVFAAGLPPDAGAALLIELDGIEAGIDDEAERVQDICMNYGARNCRLARDENERKRLWAARKGAFGAIGRIAPDSMIQDAVVPRSRLPEIMAQSYQIASKYHLVLANVFHAGDGNLHPLICFDSRSADEVRRVREAGRELMEICVRAGGSITGEHGVGLDKRDYLPLIFSEADMETMLKVRAAFDPTGLCNPGKIIPMLRGCGEGRATGNRVPEDAQPVRTTPLITAEDSRNFSTHSAGTSRVSSERLAVIVGKAYVSDATDAETCVVAPGSAEEICELMKLASSEGWSVVPRGAGTWLNAGNPLTNTTVVLSTERLNHLIDHEPADLIATAEAGLSLSSFNNELRKNAQWLPLDPPDDGRVSLGGVVATGLAGSQSYGPPRRHVIGMQVVLADGKIVNAGGRVVKNVAGYDLCKLFTGSYGTLGVITQVRFKLRPFPQSSSTILLRGTVDSLLIAAKAITSAGLFEVGCELISAAFARVAGWTDGKDALLLVRFAGSRKTVDDQTESAAALLERFGRVESAPAESGFWQTVAEMPLRMADKCSWRVNLPPASAGAFLNTLENTGARIWQAGMTTGRVRALEDNNEVGLAVSIKGLREHVDALGGSLVIENASAEIKNAVGVWGELGKRGELMKRIKEQLDPQNSLSPGRFERSMNLHLVGR